MFISLSLWLLTTWISLFWRKTIAKSAIPTFRTFSSFQRLSLARYLFSVFSEFHHGSPSISALTTHSTHTALILARASELRWWRASEPFRFSEAVLVFQLIFAHFLYTCQNVQISNEFKTRPPDPKSCGAVACAIMERANIWPQRFRTKLFWILFIFQLKNWGIS